MTAAELAPIIYRANLAITSRDGDEFEALPHNRRYRWEGIAERYQALISNTFTTAGYALYAAIHHDCSPSPWKDLSPMQRLLFSEYGHQVYRANCGGAERAAAA